MCEALIGIAVYCVLADSLCWGLNSYAEGFLPLGKTLKAFLVSFFLCPFTIIWALLNKRVKVTRKGLRMAVFYPVSLAVFILLFALTKITLLLSVLMSKLCRVADDLESRTWNLYCGFVSASGSFFDR